MNLDIITIGDEILIGQIVDTNSAWMAQKLNDVGINVREIIIQLKPRPLMTAQMAKLLAYIPAPVLPLV